MALCQLHLLSHQDGFHEKETLTKQNLFCITLDQVTKRHEDLIIALKHTP